jgi:tRNA threonylcarbamoyladenosine biosynthesis protein TsaB
MTRSTAGPLLALDSSTRMGTVAVGTAEGILSEVTVGVTANHSTALLPAIDHAMRVAGLSVTELAGVVVGSGPGSFTGLRIAAATAKGIVHARRLPLFAYSSLLATAVQAAAADGAVCALFDARGRDVFTATYRFRPTPEILRPPEAVSLDELVHRFEGSAAPTFAGEGAVRHRAELERRLGARVLDPHFGWPRAASLIWLASVDAEGGAVEKPADWQPEYVRASGAERIAASRREGEPVR